MMMVDELVDYGVMIGRNGPRWCHLTTGGTLDELHQFAERLGLQRKWCSDFTQPKANPIHYDLTPGMRAKAIRFGAVFVPAVEQANSRIRRGS